MPSLDRDDVLASMCGRFIAFYSQFTDLKPSGGEHRGPCPLHHGQRDSFAANPETGLWHCHSQCGEGGNVFDFLIRKDGLAFSDALAAVAAWFGSVPVALPRAAERPAKGTRRISATYDYIDEKGVLLYQVVRYDPKGFAQRRPAERGAWTYSLSDVRRVLYRLPEVVAATSAGKAVYVCEGEKDADALATLGLAATTAPMGAKKWDEGYSEALCGAGVVILPDNDKDGRKHAQIVAEALQGRAKRVRIVELPGLTEKGDVADWIAGGGTVAALVQLVKSTPDWNPPANPAEGSVGRDCQQAGTSREWDVPIPFTNRSLPKFPTEALPPVLAAYVSEVAASTQVPEDMAAMMTLAVMAAAGARRCIVQVGGTHVEPLNLFCVVAMEPGSRKSAIMGVAAPLREYETFLVSQETPAVAAAKEARAVEEKRLGLLRDQAAKEKDGFKRDESLHDLQELAASLTDVPALPRLLVDDVTPEKMAGLMAENAGALALLSPEGGVFGILAGRYSGKKDAENLDVFLKGHAGDEIRVDRQNRPPDYIRRPALTLGLLVQPDVISSLADSPAFRGRGLLGRFLYSLPKSLVGTRRYQNRPVDADVSARYTSAIERVLHLPDAGTKEDPSARHALTLTGEALRLWTEYADDVEVRQAEGRDLSGIRDWASKLAGAVVRIAGGFHLIERAGGGLAKPD